MKKIILFAITFLFCNPHLVLAETVALSTYYPAPFGTYDRIRLVPRTEIVGVCRVGTMYVRDTDNSLRFCRDVLLGPDAGAWGTMPGVWERDGANNVYLLDSDIIDDFHVGIGELTPDAVLEVSSSNQGFDLLMLSTDDDTDGDLFVVKADGKVGIGTIAPSVELEVQSADPADTAIMIVNTDGTTAVWELRVNASPDSFIIWGGTAGSETQRIVLSQSGNIFIDPISGGADTVTIGDSVTPPAEERLNVNGGILLKDDGINWGDLQVQYDAGTQGYYAVYAP